FGDLSFGPVAARAVVQTPPGRGDTAVGFATVNSEEVAAGGVLHLAGFGSVAGVVANPDGGPAHGATVEVVAQRLVVGSGACGLQNVLVGSVLTDEQGKFHFDTVHVGPVVVRAHSLVFPTPVSGSG